MSVTGLRNDDFRPFVWKTTDYGATWTSIAGNLPKESVNVIREDPSNADLLFAGTDLGLYGSIDGGKSWTKVTGSVMSNALAGGGFGRGGGGGGEPRGVLPTIPVYDLKIHPRDHEVILGTHGRGIWIMDIAPLEDLTPAVMAADATLLSVRPVIQWREPRATEAASMAEPSGGCDQLRAEVGRGRPREDRVYEGSRMIAEMDGEEPASTRCVGISTVHARASRRSARMRRRWLTVARRPASATSYTDQANTASFSSWAADTQRAFVLADPAKGRDWSRSPIKRAWPSLRSSAESVADWSTRVPICGFSENSAGRRETLRVGTLFAEGAQAEIARAAVRALSRRGWIRSRGSARAASPSSPRSWARIR